MILRWLGLTKHPRIDRHGLLDVPEWAYAWRLPAGERFPR